MDAFFLQPIKVDFDHVPTVIEIRAALKQLKCGNAVGEDGIPPEVWMHGGESVMISAHHLFTRIWDDELAAQQPKDATIIAIFKSKGSCSECDNYGRIFLLAIAGKVLAKVIRIA